MDVFSLILSDDDEVPEGPPPESLSEIFGDGAAPPKSLRYQPPKPTFPGEEESPDSQKQWVVLLAKIACAYKVVNHLNEPRGKVGFALLKSPDELKMILYRTKQDVLSTTMILEKFTLFTKESYLQFQDDYGAFWSVIFETEQDFEEVIRILETKCRIQREEKQKRDEHGDLDEIRVEKQETDPEDKQNKQIKANILSRMAKMGKKIVLPKMNQNSEVSDSSDTEMKAEATATAKVKPALPPRKNFRSNQNHIPALQIAQMAPGPVANKVGPVATYSEPTMMPPGPVIITNATESNLNLMISENRIQNTELRFNLTKLENKVEKILDKIEILNSNTSQVDRSNCLNRDTEIIELEERIIALKKENLNLKCKNRDLEAERCTSPTKAVCHQDVENLRTEIESIKKQNQNISLELDSKLEEIRKMEQQLQEKNQLLEDKEQDLKAKDSLIQNTILEMEEIRANLESEQNQNSNLQRQIQQLTLSLEPPSSPPLETNDNCSQTDSSNVTIELVKKIMNNSYFKICDVIGNLDESDLTQNELLKHISQIMKQETNEALRRTQGLQ